MDGADHFIGYAKTIPEAVGKLDAWKAANGIQDRPCRVSA
jgi:hypothetical protein